MSARRDPRVHLDVTRARHADESRAARQRLDALLDGEEVVSLVQPVLVYARSRPERDTPYDVGDAPWAVLRKALMERDLTTHGSLSSDLDVDAALFGRLGLELATALRDAPDDWLSIVQASLPWELVDAFLNSLPEDRIDAHFAKWSAHAATSLADCVGVTGLREENPEVVERWLKERRDAGTSPWRLVVEADRLHVHMLLAGKMAMQTLIAAHGGAHVLARWLLSLPHDYALFLAFIYVEDPSLAVSLATDPLVSASPWASACALSHALQTLRLVDQSLQHGAMGRWALTTDQEFVERYKRELQQWRAAELPEHVERLATAIGPTELALEWLRDVYLYTASTDATKEDAVAELFRARLAGAVATINGSTIACQKLCASAQAAGVLAAAHIAHAEDASPETRACVINAFAEMLKADDYPRAERHGDGHAMYWLVAGLVSRHHDAVSRWRALIDAIPRDGEGWLCSTERPRCREAEIGHYCVIGAMAAEWLVGWKRHDDAKQMLTEVLGTLQAWIRGEGASDDAVTSWAIEQAWARAPLCLKADAVRVGAERVALFDTVEQLYAAYSNLEINSSTRQLPIELRQAISDRYSLLRSTWRPLWDNRLREYYDVSALLKWFDGISNQEAHTT